jgi:formyl-CoA transferase
LWYIVTGIFFSSVRREAPVVSISTAKPQRRTCRETSETKPGPLAGIKILDLTTVVLGPLATQILADLGADVIKIEPPDGDIMRYAGPARHREMGHVFLNLNRNKRSLVLDLKQEGAAPVLLALVRQSDILMHNMRPQAMARLGFGWERLREVNPRLVYCSAHGYGQDGPFASRPAFDDIIQGGCGLVALEAATGGEARFVPTLIGDKTVGLTMVYAVMAALLQRERTGEGQAIEVLSWRRPRSRGRGPRKEAPIARAHDEAQRDRLAG